MILSVKLLVKACPKCDGYLDNLYVITSILTSDFCSINIDIIYIKEHQQRCLYCITQGHGKKRPKLKETHSINLLNSFPILHSLVLTQLSGGHEAGVP